MINENLALLGIVSLLILQVIVIPQAYAIEVLDTIEVGISPIQIALNPTTNTIYATNLDNTISVIDGTDNVVVDTIDVGTLPRGIAVNPTTNLIYVTNPLENTVSVIDGTDNVVVDTIDVAYGSFGIAVNPTTNLIYVVSCFYEINTISVIDGSNNSAINPIDVTQCAGTVEVNPLTNTIYVPNSADNTISVIGEKIELSAIIAPQEPVNTSEVLAIEFANEGELMPKVESSAIPNPIQITEGSTQNSSDILPYLGIIIAGVFVGIVAFKKRDMGTPQQIKVNIEPYEKPEDVVQERKSTSQKLQERLSTLEPETVRSIDIESIIENKIQVILKLEEYKIGSKIRLEAIKNSLRIYGSFTKNDNDYIETKYEEYKKIVPIND